MQIDVLAPDAPPAALAPACLNCAATLTGPYCAVCGQSAATAERVTFRSLWTDFRVNRLGLDRGPLITVRDVLIRPGVVALAFVEGRRRTYVHPVTFLFVAYGVYAIVFGLIEARMMGVLTTSLTEGMSVNASLPQAARDAALAGSVAYMKFAVSYGSYLSILTVLPFGFLLRRFVPENGRTVAECAVFALTVEAGVAFASGVVLNPLVAWTGSTVASLLPFALYFLLTGIGTRAFFDPRVGTLVRALAAQALALVLFMMIQGVGFLIYGVVIGIQTAG